MIDVDFFVVVDGDIACLRKRLPDDEGLVLWARDNVQYPRWLLYWVVQLCYHGTQGLESHCNLDDLG